MTTRLLLVILLISHVHAQDERFYRKIFTGELFEQKKEQTIFKVKVKSDVYQLDIDRDGVPEGIIVEKKDGQDYLRIVTNFGIELFKYKFQAKGPGSVLYKIQLKTLSKNTDVLALHYYEGFTGHTEFEASARLYFMTVDDRDIKTLSVFRGPVFFHEKEKYQDQYWNRNFVVNIVDYNKDGVREVGVSFNNMNRIYFYRGGGRWIDI